MRSWIPLLVIGTAVITSTGCGGSNAVNPNTYLYTGKWTGTWTGPETKDAGAITLNLDTHGDLTGTIVRSDGQSGTIEGYINQTGKLTGVASFPSDGTFLLGGQVTLATANATTNLNGTFTYKWNGTVYNGTFTSTQGTAA